MSSPQGMKSAHRKFALKEKLAGVEHEIKLVKQSVREAGRRLDVLRDIAIDYRAAIAAEAQPGARS